METYVHGYSEKESYRLKDQADTLESFFHDDPPFAPGTGILEAGCGIGAQTLILAKRNPEAIITSVDISPESLRKAKAVADRHGISNVSFEIADIYDLPYEENRFDHIFVCFVLEHLPDPLTALEKLGKALKKGGTITVIEGDHGSFFCHPETEEAKLAVRCLIDIQAGMNGNSLIGRQLYPLLKKAGFDTVRVSPRVIYADSGRPDIVEGFAKNTFIAMIEGVREKALGLKLTDEKTWDKGISDLYRTTEEDGMFHYSFFKGTAVRQH